MFLTDVENRPLRLQGAARRVCVLHAAVEAAASICVPREERGPAPVAAWQRQERPPARAKNVPGGSVERAHGAVHRAAAAARGAGALPHDAGRACADQDQDGQGRACVLDEAQRDRRVPSQVGPDGLSGRQSGLRQHARRVPLHA